MRNASAALLLLLLPPALYAQTAVLTFEAAEKAMLAANPQTAAAAMELETARLRAAAARAGFYPSFSADASYGRSGGQGRADGNSYSYGIGGTQPLFAPSVPAAVRAADAAVKRGQAAYNGITSDLRYQLKTAFASILNSRETIKLSEETLKRRAENLELIRLKYQAGRENKAALLETDAALKTAQWQHEKYKNAQHMLERGLNRLLGRAAQAPAPELELPLPPAPPEEFSVFSKRLEAHYSLVSARAALAAAEVALDGAKNAFLPSASASGGYSWSGTDWPGTSNGWRLGASVSVPLFSSGRLSSDLAAEKTSWRAAEFGLKNVSDEVYLNAEEAFFAWREAGAYMNVAKSSLDAAEARAWLVRKQYLAGQASYFEWRNVEDQFITGQNQYLAAGRGLILSHAAFVRAIGE